MKKTRKSSMTKLFPKAQSHFQSRLLKQRKKMEEVPATPPATLLKAEKSLKSEKCDKIQTLP